MMRLLLCRYLSVSLSKFNGGVVVHVEGDNVGDFAIISLRLLVILGPMILLLVGDILKRSEEYGKEKGW